MNQKLTSFIQVFVSHGWKPQVKDFCQCEEQFYKQTKKESDEKNNNKDGYQSSIPFYYYKGILAWGKHIILSKTSMVIGLLISISLGMDGYDRSK